ALAGARSSCFYFAWRFYVLQELLLLLRRSKPTSCLCTGNPESNGQKISKRPMKLSYATPLSIRRTLGRLWGDGRSRVGRGAKPQLGSCHGALQPILVAESKKLPGLLGLWRGFKRTRKTARGRGAAGNR